MTVFQIVVLLFSLFVIVRTLIKYVQHNISLREWLLWTLFWIIVGVATLLPQTTDIIASRVGLETGRGVDLAVYSAVPILFYLIFRLFARVDKLDQQITTVVREVAIKVHHEGMINAEGREDALGHKKDKK